MMKLSRLCAAVLAVTLTFAGLAGCSKPADSSGGTGETGTGAGNGSGSGKDTAMGRYVEEDIPLPGDAEDLAQRFLRLVQRDDGKIFLYALAYAEENMAADVLCYLWNGSGWDEQESKLNQVKVEGFGNPSVQQLDDGTEYLCYINWDTYKEEDMTIHTYIVKAAADEEPILISGGPMTTAIPDYIHVYSDGSFILSSYRNAVSYSPDGVKGRELAQGAAYTDVRTLVTAGKTGYVTSSLDEASLTRFDPQTGQAEETVPIVRSESEYADSGALTLDQEGNIYMCNASGIHFWKKGGSIWETLADGKLNSLSMPSRSVQEIALGTEDDYLILAFDAGGPAVLRFYFNPDVASVPTGTLTIFGLEDSPTVRQAISLFQKSNPEVRVDFQVGDGGDGSATVTDVIKALNTELVNQKGADILILDGLPVSSYIEKGVLADLGGVVNPMLDDNTLLRKQAGFTRNKDNTIYNVPIRFQYPIMYGTPEGLAAMQSLATVRDYNGSLPAFKNGNYQETLSFLMNMYYAELFDDSGMIPEDRLVLLLETAKAVYDKGNVRKEEMPEDEVNLFLSSNKFGLDTINSLDLYNGKAVITIEMLSGVHNIMLPAEMMKQLGLKPVSANGVFYPTQMVGINASSGSKELAEDFIRLLLSEEIQSAELYDGFPVNRQAFEGWAAFRNEDTMLGISTVSDDGAEQQLTATWPSAEQQKDIFALQEEMVTPVILDRVLTEMIIDEAKEFFDGKVDAQGAADAVLSRSALYFAE